MSAMSFQGTTVPVAIELSGIVTLLPNTCDSVDVGSAMTEIEQDKILYYVLMFRRLGVII